MSRMLVVHVFAVLLIGASAFVFNSNNCPAQRPCRCYSTVIQCASHRLDAVPAFNLTSHSHRSTKLDLQRNAIVNITANAFADLHMTPHDTLELLLQDNKISTIDDDAFVTLENTTLEIELSNNNLRTLPRAFLKTNKVTELRLLGNAIVFLDREVVAHLGPSLRTLWLGMESMAIWQQDFSLLTDLYELILEKVPFHSLPPDAFSGLDDLRRLEFTKPRLETIPEALCSLESLNYFRFMEDQYILNNQEVLNNCLHYLRTVSTVDLSNNQLFSFPKNIFKVFLSPHSLTLSFNNIDHIDDKDVPDRCTLYYLYLSDNRFRAIPPVVAKMKDLLTLSVSNNKITHIGDNLFSALPKFKQLVISGNPLVSIDPHAFSSFNTLSRLVLDHTNMTSIPTAIMHSSDGLSLSMNSCPLVCTCDTMYFMKYFTLQPSTYHSYYGSCTGNTTTSLRSFVLNEVPNC